MAKTKETPVVTDVDAATSPKRSQHALSTARGGLADQLRIASAMMLQLADNPVINDLDWDTLTETNAAIDALLILKETIEGN